uniref:Cytochrome b561 domain-containing protein n=1 Tax=Strigamia maritima TaxID=126957 RepID=T1JPC0_STRMM
TRTKEPEKWNYCTCSWFFILLLALQVLLWGSVALAIYWVMGYRGGFGWNEKKRKLNIHPVLMIGGFVFFMGQSMLMYRTCRCCRHIYTKLFHTVVHLVAMPTIIIGVVVAFDYHDSRGSERSSSGSEFYETIRGRFPIPHLYSLHSWLGVATLGLFAIQFIVGFFSFLVLLCCDSKTASFRSKLQPIHTHFGLATFLLAIGTCVTGLTQKVIEDLNERGANGVITGPKYQDLPPEGLVVNVLAVVLVAAGLLMAFIIRYAPFRGRRSDLVGERL